MSRRVVRCAWINKLSVLPLYFYPTKCLLKVNSDNKVEIKNASVISTKILGEDRFEMMGKVNIFTSIQEAHVYK